MGGTIALLTSIDVDGTTIDFYVDDEGLLKGLSCRFKVGDLPFAGNLVVCSSDAAGDSYGLDRDLLVVLHRLVTPLTLRDVLGLCDG